MATLHFSGTDVKVFTPVSTALANLPNGAGTIVVLVKQTLAGGQDYCGLLDSTAANYYHGLVTTSSAVAPADRLMDDDGVASTRSTTTFASTTDWFLFAVDWPAGATAATPRFHWRDQTTLAAWSHENASTVNGGNRAGPGTTGRFRLGSIADFSTGAKDQAVVAVWAGTRFTDSDYGLWNKTSDLYNHALGRPTFLCQLNAATLVDLIGGSTYSSANSSGTALTGADPVNWTMDGIGSARSPQRPRVVRPRAWRPAGARFAR